MTTTPTEPGPERPYDDPNKEPKPPKAPKP
jgi:hypothetical protein